MGQPSVGDASVRQSHVAQPGVGQPNGGQPGVGYLVWASPVWVRWPRPGTVGGGHGLVAELQGVNKAFGWDRRQGGV